MKKLISLFVFLIFIGITSNVHAQLTGIKTIPGNYANIAAAITDLNSQGVGSGGVTFNVAAGYTETASNLVIAIITNQPTEANPIVFQKTGAGTNPLLLAAPGTSSSLDGIIKLSGADYITFDRIDLLDPASNTGDAMMEWGYALLRASTTDGSQNNVFKNCMITLQKANTFSVGIYLANRDTAGGFVYISDPPGRNSYNKFYGNSISNVYKGIVAVSELFSRDINNEIGVNGLGFNLITNLGGSNEQAEGIRCAGQENAKINNNVINGGAGTTNRVAGIIVEEYEYLDYEISYNQVTITSDTYAADGISAGGAYVPFGKSDTMLIHHNIVENCVASSGFSGVNLYAIYVDAAYIYNNIVRNNTDSGSGYSTLLGGGNSFLVMHSNEVYGNQKTGISGTMECIGGGSMECYSNMIYNNSIPNSSGTGSSIIYGINNQSLTSEKIFDNTIYNLSVGGTNTSTASLVAGISCAYAVSNEIYGNQIYGLSGVSGTSTTGGVYGIHNPSTGSITRIHKNKIHNLTNNGTMGTTAGCWVSSGTSIQIYNNSISELKTPNSTNANAVIGINCTSTTPNSTVGIYFNSIFLTGTGGSTFGSSGISVTANATATTAELVMRNNIIVNLSSSIIGFPVTYRRSSANLQNYALTSNYNLFDAGDPLGRHFIFYDETTATQIFSVYQSIVFPRDSNSKSVFVNFQDPVNGDLHLIGASIGDPNLIGTPIPGITTDIDGQPRSATSPYIGADEPLTKVTLNLKINLQACSPIPDTITVLLRDTISPYTVVDSARGVIDSAGSVALNFANAVNGARYYIVVKHRNSIETWSKLGGEVFTGGVLNYDFTTAASKAFGSNQILVGSKFSIYTGDVNQDGVVDLADGSLIDNDAFNFVSGYVNTDLNCDGVVDLADATFADNNGFNFVQVLRP